MLAHGTVPLGNYKGFEDSFARLPEDQYADPGYRFRRYSQYRMVGDKPELVETDHFMQSKDLNKAFGDIERKFEPMEPEMLKREGFNWMFKQFQFHTGCNMIDCHQVRIMIGAEGAPAAPEGRHQDGYDFIGAFIVTRENMVGGDFMVWRDMDEEEAIFKKPLLGEFAIIDDKKYYHTGDQLGVVNPNKPGRWEWFVLGGYR